MSSYTPKEVKKFVRNFIYFYMDDALRKEIKDDMNLIDFSLSHWNGLDDETRREVINRSQATVLNKDIRKQMTPEEIRMYNDEATYTPYLTPESAEGDVEDLEKVEEEEEEEEEEAEEAEDDEKQVAPVDTRPGLSKEDLKELFDGAMVSLKETQVNNMEEVKKAIKDQTDSFLKLKLDSEDPTKLIVNKLILEGGKLRPEEVAVIESDLKQIKKMSPEEAKKKMKDVLRKKFAKSFKPKMMSNKSKVAAFQKLGKKK